MFLRNVLVVLLCILFSLLLISNVQAGNFTCRSNLTYASDYYTCGGDLVDNNKYEEALEAFRTARSMDERFYDEHFGLSYQIGWILNRLGRYEEALIEFEKAEKYHPAWINDFVIYYNEGVLLAKLGKNEEALKRFNSSLTVQYYNVYAWFNKGLVLAKMGRYTEAKDAFEKARKAYGSWVPLLGSYREAANTYDIAKGVAHPEVAPTPATTSSTSRSVYPTPTYIVGLSIDLQLRKANDFSARYQFDDAVQAYDQVLVNDPSNYRAMKGKGVALANLGRFDDALISLDRAILYLDYHLDESNYVDAWYTKGWILANQGKYDEAIEAFKKILIVTPDYFYARYNKAWVLAKKGEYNAAVEEYNRSLDWENQMGYEVKTGTILGALGDYKDAADAIDKANTPDINQQQVQTPSQDMLIYQTDFSQDPLWQTNRQRDYFWNATKQVYYFISDENPGYAEIPVPYNGTSFRLEFDISILHADPGTTALFGISQYNTTYNEQNAIFAEFKSWKSGTYRNVKNGDKIYQIKAIDNLKHTTNEQYQGACFVNREEDRTNPTFGENRIYHVIIEYNNEKNIIETRVTDNLHEKNYFVCSGIWYDIGEFKNMNRLILVVREDEVAYIEGFIDNVKLYSVDTTVPAPSLTPTPTVTSTLTVTPTVTPTPQAQQEKWDMLAIILPLLVAGVAGTGLYVWKKSRKMSPPEQVRQSVLKLQQSVATRIAALEFFPACARTLYTDSEDLIRQEKYEESEKLLLKTDKKVNELEKSEHKIRQWRNEGFEISQLVTKVNNNPDILIPAFTEFENALGKSRDFRNELDKIIRDHRDIINEPEISRHIEWLQQNITDPYKNEKVKEELKEVRNLVFRYEDKKNRIAGIRNLLDYVILEGSGLAVFGTFIQSRIATAKSFLESERFDSAYETLKKTEAEIDELKQYEDTVRNWKSLGYSTTNLEKAHYDSFEDIKTRLVEFKEQVDKSRIIRERLQNLKETHQKVLSSPRFASLVTILEQKITDPDEAASVEKEVLSFEQEISRTLHGQKELAIKIRSHLDKIKSAPSLRDSIRKTLVPVDDAYAAEDFVLAERMLGDLAAQNIGSLKKEIDDLKREGAVFTKTPEFPDGLLLAKNYADAILETEKCFEKTEQLKQAFAQAKSFYGKTTDPDLLEVYRQGKYTEFIQLVRNRINQTEKITAARTIADELLAQAEKIGKVPESVYTLLNSSGSADLEKAAEDLRNFIKTATPHLYLTLDRQYMEAHVWHRVNISIENKGDAHALDVNFSFSREFETRWIRPKSINAGKIETFENIAIHPNIKGEVPLEISLTYHDARNTEYTEKQEFFINVTESGTPHTPQYSPQATPSKIASAKELPPELAHMYTDSRYIGRGGFARVYKATKRDGKNVAIKIPISIDPSTGRTFVSEIQNWTKMVHENIVKVYEYNIMPPYFEMELCDESLANLKKPMENEKAAWLAFSICEGLKYAHSQNIIHRDLKPQNILLKNGIPKISDWGLSRVMVTQSTTAAPGSFTLYYAAPEQVNNRKQDARTDLWQLGVIFYELTTGILPFKGETVTDTIIAIATQNPAPPSSVNPDAKELDPIVMRCLEKDPARRYQTVLDLQKDIGEFLKMNYSNSLNESLITKNYGRSADYCADLLLVNMKLGGIVGVYKYASDLAQYVTGDVKLLAEEFAEQIRIRMEMNLVSIPDELIKKAEILVHKVKFKRK